VAVGVVNVRSDPAEPGSYVIGWLYLHDSTAVMQNTEKWSLIHTDSLEGWVRSDLLACE
jgi:SH3-like domain-containing protein